MPPSAILDLLDVFWSHPQRVIARRFLIIVNNVVEIVLVGLVLAVRKFQYICAFDLI